MGGEEFAIALTDTNLQDALTCAEVIRSKIAEPAFETSAGTVSVSISVGAACANEKCFDLDALLEQSDLALYQAKGEGRNCVNSFDHNAA